MKKILIPIVCVILAVLIAGGLAVNTLSGSWHTTLDMGARLSQGIELLNEVPLEDLQVPFVLTFGKDGTCSFRVDEERLAGQMPQLREQIGDALINTYQHKGVGALEKLLQMGHVEVNLGDLLSEHDLSLEKLVDLVFRFTGLSFDALLEKSITAELVAQLCADAQADVSYKALPGILFLSGEDGTIDLGAYLTFSVSEDVLTIESGGQTHEKLPLVLNR